MKYSITVLVFCVFLITDSKCANILFFSATPSHSHQVMFQPVWRELSLRGHKVVAITPNPLNDPKLTNLTEIDLSSTYQMMKETTPKDKVHYIMKKPDFLTVFIKDGIMTKLFHDMGRYVFHHPNMQAFLQKDYKFDVVIVEWLYPTFAALAAKYQAPLIGITSLGAPIPALDTVGNPSHPVYAPDHNLPVSREMTFKERLMSGLWALYVRINYHLVVLPREDGLAREFLGENIPYLGDIERNISLLLLNRNPVFHRIMPVVPAVIELGHMNQNKSVDNLDKELKEFLDNSKNGVVYFSLGSNVQASYLPKHTLDAIINTFRNIPYDVIFKWNADVLKNKPKNVLIRKWVPQAAILRHPNTKLFITQGGLQSSDEAIINQVPVIGIPFYSDQTANADTLARYGMGKYLDYEDLTEEILTNYIKEIISNPSYKENAIKLSQIYTDQPVDALDKAIWWIEYVIRHKGAAHLRSSSMDIPWYQYLMLDIFAFIVAILATVLLVFYLLSKLIILVVKKLFIKNTCKAKNKSKKE